MEKILVREHRRKDGSLLGEIALNRPSALNALDYDTASVLHEALQSRLRRPEIRLIFIHSLSRKAFCSGGDLKYLYHKMQGAANSKQDPAEAVRPFFEKEYPVNYMLRTFPKPVVVWGEGLVMGGGMGLLSAASHPVVTETSHLAMPEIKIGFFPDVAAGLFLNRFPLKIGLYLGLTGASFNCKEFLFLNPKALCFRSRDKESFFQFLLSVPQNALEGSREKAGGPSHGGPNLGGPQGGAALRSGLRHSDPRRAESPHDRPSSGGPSHGGPNLGGPSHGGPHHNRSSHSEPDGRGGADDEATSGAHKELSDRLCHSFSLPSESEMPENRLKPLSSDIQKLLETEDIREIDERMKSLPSKGPFWDKNKKTFLKGAPASLAVFCEQMQRARGKNLREIVKMEMTLALAFARRSDFKEGIRALLIDKTRDPKWDPPSLPETEDMPPYFNPLPGGKEPDRSWLAV